ncbi:MAG: DUF4388 domain-containing protein [Deltaproteobacteria bacterium]|nr:DUF4388 domain-containing protein [Deltaproteobacteria bacterium]
MEGLAGDLGTMPINDLVLYLGNRNATGTLVCDYGHAKKSVSIRAGSIINAASNDPREYLGQFLINFGHISEDQLIKAFQTQTETRIFLGRILVMIGIINEETLKQVLIIKFRETLLGLFRWRQGFFKFARNVLPPDEDAVQVEVPLLDVHREGEFRETAWEAMLQTFPKGSLALRVEETKLPRELAPGALDTQLFALMREQLTIDEICLRLHATDFHLYQRLYALYRQGMIVPYDPKSGAPPPPPTEQAPVGEEPPAEEILKHAKEFLAAKQFAYAEKLASRANELKSSPEAQAVLKAAEAGLLVALRNELVNAPRIPQLAVSPPMLKELDLSPQERYLLSRIDGNRDIKAIIRVSPIREIDALKSFTHFIEQGLIQLK